jgi:hypothetical protein
MQKVKPKKCKYCGDEYTPFNSFQKSCTNPPCALQAGKDLKTKKHKKELTEYRKKNTSVMTVKAKAQQAFNEYVRFRDYHKPCISCDKPASYGSNEWDAGHYVATGSQHGNSLRFNLKNCFKQCKRCNSSPPRGLGGNYTEYRKRLIARYGEAQILELEYNVALKPMSKDYLERVKKIFNKKTRMKKKRLGIS